MSQHTVNKSNLSIPLYQTTSFILVLSYCFGCLAGALVLSLPLAAFGQATAQQESAQQESTHQQGPNQLYKVEPGKLEIRKVDQLKLNRANQSDLAIRVTYPVTELDEKLPVIVFSHGAGGSRKSYEPLIEHWASHGYVCVQPTHGDSVSLLRPRELRKYRSFRDYLKSGILQKHQLTRPQDVKLILDKLDWIANQLPDLKGRLDLKRIGMGGHSFGAHTTNMIGGMTLCSTSDLPANEPGGRISVADSRPIALLMISPQGRGAQVDHESWQDITRPSMVITGTRDKGIGGQSYKWRLDAYQNLKCQKYLGLIDDAKHTFGGIANKGKTRLGIRNDKHVDYVRSLTLAFWDAHLKDNEQAKQVLQSGKIDEFTNNEVQLTAEQAK